MKSASACALIAAVLVTACAAYAPPQPGFDLAYLGRDAIFIDSASVVRDGEAVSFRSLRVQDSQFKAGETIYLGGFARARLDCRTRTYQLVSFQSIKPGFVLGPDSAVRPNPFPIASGSPEAAMAHALCDRKPAYAVHAATADDAVAIGRKRLDSLN